MCMWSGPRWMAASARVWWVLWTWRRTTTRRAATRPSGPSESTVVERIPPRLKVRRGALLETPHVMMLADDAGKTLIEPIGACKEELPLLYDGELMLGGGHLRGWAVEDPAVLPRSMPPWRRWLTRRRLPGGGRQPRARPPWCWPLATATTAWPRQKPTGRS